MLFYVGIIFIIALTSELLKYFVYPQKRMQFKALWGGFILAFFAACRAETVGVDTPQYVAAYKYIATLDWGNVISGTGLGSFEVGYRILTKAFSLISTSEHFFLLWTSVVTIVPMVIYIYKYSKSPTLSYIIYLLSGQYFMQIGVIRQSIAFSIVLLAFMLVIEKKEHWLINAVILILIASTIHTAAIVAIAVVLTAKTQKVNFKFYLNCVLATLMIMIFGQSILAKIITRFSSYAGYANQGGGVGRIVIIGAIVLFVLLYKEILYEVDNRAAWWEKMLCLTFLLKVFSYFFVAASRAAALFETSYVVVIPNTVSAIQKRDKIIWMFIIIGLFSFFYYTGYDARNSYIFWM